MHLEFSFYTHTCNFGDAVRTGTNPFTGETTEFPVDDGMTEDEIDAVQDIFDDNGIEGPEPEHEGYAVFSDDGSSIRFRCHDLDAGDPITGIPIELVVPHLTDEVLTIIMDVARAGNLALTSVTGEDVRLIEKQPDSTQLKRWPDAATIGSVADLRDWLNNVIGSGEVNV